jgi:hypothetical protein
MKHLVFLFVVVFAGAFSMVMAQKRWDGGAGTNRWSDALNWTNNTLPGAFDDVLLDNSIIGSSYQVVMPNFHGTVRSITIQPAQGRNIELSLPTSNRDVPGFTVSGPGYGMNIYPGGVFRNASGSGSGAAILVRDSIRIFNDGRYIHNTTGGHVNAVEVLSRAAGTELGIFEIDIPAASATISLSERVFGRLILRSTAAGGNTSYTAAGTSRCVIRGDFEIDPGANVVLNFEDTIFVNRHFLQRGGRFNFGSTLRSAALHISGDFVQSAGAEIAEYGSASHSIIMGGPSTQQMTANGFWFNEVSFVKTGPGTVLLRSPLRLPFRCELLSGYIATNNQWHLILSTSCTMHSDSLATNTGILGPITKEGLFNSSMLIPVGVQNRMRWLRLEQATGGFTITYRKVDPQNLSNTLGAGLHHISEVEYWDVTGFPNSSAYIKLSFSDPHSGGVTELSSLRPARLVNNLWENAGVSATGGSPGSRGWVRSNLLTWPSTLTTPFTLASTSATQNPLPLENTQLNINKIADGLHFSWRVYDKDHQPLLFEIQHSEDGREFKRIATMEAGPQMTSYAYLHKGLPDHGYFRLGIKLPMSERWIYTSAVRLKSELEFEIRNLLYRPGYLSFYLNSETRDEIIAEVVDAQGRIVFRSSFSAPVGRSQIKLPVFLPRSGMYVLRLRGRRNQQVMKTLVFLE